MALLAYGIIIAIGGVVLRTDPLIFTSCMAGAGLSFLWGGLWISGRGRKVWPILTSMLLGFVFLSKAVNAWFEMGSVPIQTAVLLSALCLFTVVVLMRVAYAGIFNNGMSKGDLPPGDTTPEVGHSSRSALLTARH